MDPLPTLALSVATRDALVEHLRLALPNEGCGMLIERGDGELCFRGALNSLASPTRYSVDPEDLLAAYREADATGGRVIAAVHSHPEGPAGPSARDQREWLTPELAMIIVSFEAGGQGLRAYYVAEAGRELRPWPLEILPGRP